MEELYVQINELVQDLLIPARIEKSIDAEAFKKFYVILSKLENKLKGAEYIPRKIAGIFYFIYISLSAEATYCNYNDELFIAVATVEDMVGKILWDSPFENGMG